MKIKTITISDAVKAYKKSRSTLTSWVSKNKVRSEKRLVGGKEIHFIEVDSLEAHIKERSIDQPSNSPEEAIPAANKTASLRGSPTTPKTRRKRKKPRRKTPCQIVKNSMRGFEIPELINIQEWVMQRVKGKVTKGGNAKGQVGGKKITKDKENGK